MYNNRPPTYTAHGGLCSTSIGTAPPPRPKGGSVLRQRRVRSTKSTDDSGDVIERLVGRLFGQAALDDPNPGGLKRMSEDAKELYPAPTDSWAAPVAGDDEEISLLRPLLAQTQLESAPLRLAYDANQEGWTAAAFHQCDGFGPALVVAKTVGGAILGGYNPRGWISLGEESRDSIAAFLFTWQDGDTSKLPIKLPKVGGSSMAVVRDQPGGGIMFGADGLAIPMTPGKEKLARCKLGPFYAKMPDGSQSLFAKGENPKATELVSLRIYVAEGTGEEWELDGILWKTKL